MVAQTIAILRLVVEQAGTTQMVEMARTLPQDAERQVAVAAGEIAEELHIMAVQVVLTAEAVVAEAVELLSAAMVVLEALELLEFGLGKGG